MSNLSIKINGSLDGTHAVLDDDDREDIDKLLARLPPLQQNFDVHRKIGEGTFSSVYLASLKAHRHLPASQRRLYAIKHLVPTSHPARIEQELRCLREIGGKENVISVELCLRNMDTVVFVMPYIPHQRFSEVVETMDVEEMRRYMQALLVALRRVHSMGVIHRDVKPGNFLYDRVGQRYQLVDFGLAQRVITSPQHIANSRKRKRDEGEEGPPNKRSTHPQVSTQCACAGCGCVCVRCSKLGTCRAARAGTAGYRAPEVLLRVPRQGSALDVWAAGVLLLAAAAPRSPLSVAPRCDLAALAHLLGLLGTRAITSAAAALGRRIVVSRTHRGLCLRKLCKLVRSPENPNNGDATPQCPHCGMAMVNCLCLKEGADPTVIRKGVQWAGLPDELFSLLYSLLEPNPDRRCTADQALRHPFIISSYPSKMYSV